MYEEKDYIMRLIHELIRTLIKLLCGADPDRSEEELLPAAKKGRYLSLRQMLDDGEINQAENLLQEELDIHDRADLEMALLFYRSLNRKSDEFLEDHNFPGRKSGTGSAMWWICTATEVCWMRSWKISEFL